MADVSSILEEIKGLTVIELKDLVSKIEDEFGVSATPVVQMGGGGGAAEAEKTDFNVVLAEVGSNKIAVIKVVREVAGLGLKEAKELVDKAPGVVKEGVPTEEANDIKAKFEKAGAKVELK